MFIRSSYIPTGRMLFSAVGGDGGGTPGGAAPPAGGAAPPADGAGAGAPPVLTAPWGTDPNAPYLIGDKPWYETLPDGPTKELYRAKNYANPIVAFDSHYSANKMVQAPDRTLVLPGENATEAERTEFDKRLRTVKGAFDDPNKYDIKIPEGVEADANLLSFAKTAAAKYGLSPKEAQQLVDDWNAAVPNWNTSALEAQQQKNLQAVEDIKAREGAHFDEFLQHGKRAYASVGLPPEVVSQIEAHIGAAPLIELLVAIGKKSAEGGFGGNGAGGGSTGSVIESMTKEQATAEHNRLMADAEFTKAYNDAKHPQHKEAVDKVVRLFARM